MPIDNKCFYCGTEIGTEPRIIGDPKQRDCHQRCVEQKLDKLDPDWRRPTHNHGNGRGGDG